jgi:hypothetical protein
LTPPLENEVLESEMISSRKISENILKTITETLCFVDNCEKQMEICQGLFPNRVQEKHQDET